MKAEASVLVSHFLEGGLNFHLCQQEDESERQYVDWTREKHP